MHSEEYDNRASFSVCVGLNCFAFRKEVEIPDGYELKFTDKGQSYLVREKLFVFFFFVGSSFCLVSSFLAFRARQIERPRR